MRHHADLLAVGAWHAVQQVIAAGQVQDVFPYPDALRFCNLFGRC